MIWRRLDELFQVLMELPDQEIDGDRQPGLDPPVHYRTVVSEQVGHRDVKMTAPDAVVAEPGFGLLGQPVDQNQRVLPTVREEEDDFVRASESLFAIGLDLQRRHDRTTNGPSGDWHPARAE